MACRSSRSALRPLSQIQCCQSPESPNALRFSAISRSSRFPTAPLHRAFSSTTRVQEENEVVQQELRPSSGSDAASSSASAYLPRYAHTPVRMKAPVSLRKPAIGTRWECNEDPVLLDRVYNTILGDSGDRMLTEDVKWLAVTHKSFDQGRRGFNDRLAFLGKQIVSVQVSLALLNRTDGTFHSPPDRYAASRQPFQHPGLDLLPRLTPEARKEALDVHHVAQVASKMGLLKVVRWKPRDIRNIVKSGGELVLAQALYAIIGAVALQRGGEVATRIVKDRILSHLEL